MLIMWTYEIIQSVKRWVATSGWQTRKYPAQKHFMSVVKDYWDAHHAVWDEQEAQLNIERAVFDWHPRPDEESTRKIIVEFVAQGTTMLRDRAFDDLPGARPDASAA